MAKIAIIVLHFFLLYNYSLGRPFIKMTYNQNNTGIHPATYTFLKNTNPYHSWRDESQAVRNQVEPEATTIKSLLASEIIKIYGDSIPNITSSDVEEATKIASNIITEVKLALPDIENSEDVASVTTSVADDIMFFSEWWHIFGLALGIIFVMTLLILVVVLLTYIRKFFGLTDPTKKTCCCF